MNKKQKNKFRNKKQKKQIVYPTSNAKLVGDTMKLMKIRGNYKNYIVFTGNAMFDWLGTYKIKVKNNNEEKIGLDKTFIVHKKFLSSVIGEKEAKLFWTCGMRTNHGVEQRRQNCITR